MAEIPLVHLYGQLIWHDEELIAGNTSGITKLRDALNQALAFAQARTEVTTSDGEGYDLHIVCQNEDWQSDIFQGLRMPYTTRKFKRFVENQKKLIHFR